MYWLWGILLGIILTAALPLLAGILSLSNRMVGQEDAMLVSIALVLFCLLGVLIFKPSGAVRPVRMMRNRSREEKE